MDYRTNGRHYTYDDGHEDDDDDDDDNHDDIFWAMMRTSLATAHAHTYSHTEMLKMVLKNCPSNKYNT